MKKYALPRATSSGSRSETKTPEQRIFAKPARPFSTCVPCGPGIACPARPTAAATTSTAAAARDPIVNRISSIFNESSIADLRSSINVLLKPPHHAIHEVELMGALGNAMSLARIGDVLDRHALPFQSRVQLQRLSWRHARIGRAVDDERRRLRAVDVLERRSLPVL